MIKWPNGQTAKWPNGQMAKWPNGQMAKWPNGAIEGVNVLKVIPRPTALAVGKKHVSLADHWQKIHVNFSKDDFSGKGHLAGN
jgi:hypothetical protein